MFQLTRSFSKMLFIFVRFCFLYIFYNQTYYFNCTLRINKYIKNELSKKRICYFTLARTITLLRKVLLILFHSLKSNTNHANPFSNCFIIAILTKQALKLLCLSYLIKVRILRMISFEMIIYLRCYEEIIFRSIVRRFTS